MSQKYGEQQIFACIIFLFLYFHVTFRDCGLSTSTEKEKKSVFSVAGTSVSLCVTVRIIVVTKTVYFRCNLPLSTGWLNDWWVGHVHLTQMLSSWKVYDENWFVINWIMTFLQWHQDSLPGKKERHHRGGISQIKLIKLAIIELWTI